MKIKQIWKDGCPFNTCGQGGILFDNGTALIDIHESDCCENVYADFSTLDSDILNYNFQSIKIENAKNGFRFGDSRRKFYIPCYNEQNGYYSDILEIQYGKVIEKITKNRKGKIVITRDFIPTAILKDCEKEDLIY